MYSRWPCLPLCTFAQPGVACLNKAYSVCLQRSDHLVSTCSATLLLIQVQIQEPVLVTPEAEKLRPAVEATFAELAKVGVPVNLTTLYDDLGPTYTWVTKLPVRCPAAVT